MSRRAIKYRIPTRPSFCPLQVDLQSSEREKERLLAELDKLHGLTDNLEELKKENQKLRRNLSERESVVEMVDGDLNVSKQLNDTLLPLEYVQGIKVCSVPPDQISDPPTPESGDSHKAAPADTGCRQCTETGRGFRKGASGHPT